MKGEQTAAPQQQILMRAYNDGVIKDEVQIFEEVYDIEDVKHSSSMLADTEQKNDKEPSNLIDDQKKRKQLKQELTQYRIDQASAIEKPAYNIFTNAALEGICASLPQNEEALLEVKGIGPKKLEMYGDDIFDIVKKYVDADGLEPQIISSNKSKVPRPELINIESLTHEQKKAAEMVLGGKSVFISGAAGTGKSHVSKYIIQTLQQKMKKVSPTAPTGVAAINVGGTTLHSFFGIGLGMGSTSTLVRKIRKKSAVLQRLNETDVLLIDEVSMLSCELLDTLDGIARLVRAALM